MWWTHVKANASTWMYQLEFWDSVSLTAPLLLWGAGQGWVQPQLRGLEGCAAALLLLRLGLGVNPAWQTGTLLVLRELFDPHSRFKPYIKARDTDSADGYLSEMDRLTKLLDDLQQVDASFDEAAWPAPGTDYVFDMVMGLKQRRREAIRYEVARLASKLEALSAGGQEL
ncbi:hypothetical protein V8C86DRAFT_2433805 [Haematococcus lacustris]